MCDNFLIGVFLVLRLAFPMATAELNFLGEATRRQTAASLLQWFVLLPERLLVVLLRSDKTSEIASFEASQPVTARQSLLYVCRVIVQHCGISNSALDLIPRSLDVILSSLRYSRSWYYSLSARIHTGTASDCFWSRMFYTKSTMFQCLSANNPLCISDALSTIKIMVFYYENFTSFIIVSQCGKKACWWCHE